MDKLRMDSYIKPLDSVVRADEDENLGTVLSLVSSSHTPIFIYSKSNKFMGIVSPYQVIYSHSYPYATKVSSIVTRPPYLSQNTPLYDIASAMLSSKVYLLPVFNDNSKIEGIIDIKEVVKRLVKDIDLLTYLSKTLKINEPITAHINSTVGEIYQVMKKKSISRVILVNDKGSVAGIVSRKDLLKAFIMPTAKQRFGKNGIPQTDWAFDGEKKYRKDEPVKAYAKTLVSAISFEAPIEEMIYKLTSCSVNSLLITNSDNKPIGFLSLRDIITAISLLRPEASVNIIINKPTKNVSEEEIEKAEKYLIKFSEKMNKRISIEKIEVNSEEPKYPTGETAIYNASLIVTPLTGAKIVAKSSKTLYFDSIKTAADQIMKQEQRREKTKKELRHVSIDKVLVF